MIAEGAEAANLNEAGESEGASRSNKVSKQNSEEGFD